MRFGKRWKNSGEKISTTTIRTSAEKSSYNLFVFFLLLLFIHHLNTATNPLSSYQCFMTINRSCAR